MIIWMYGTTFTSTCFFINIRAVRLLALSYEIKTSSEVVVGGCWKLCSLSLLCKLHGEWVSSRHFSAIMKKSSPLCK